MSEYEEIVRLRGILTQQAQELGRCKSEKNDAVIELYRKLDAKDAELAASQARCREMEANQRRTPTENETVCYACDGSGWVDR